MTEESYMQAHYGDAPPEYPEPARWVGIALLAVLVVALFAVL